jgi:hypothetical protein
VTGIEYPARFVRADEARARFGGRADQLAAALSRTDPLAEAVVAAFAKLQPGRGREMLERAIADGIDAIPDAPDALVELFAHLDTVPAWVDWDALDIGARMYMRHGVLGAAVIAGYAAPVMYASPAGNKPLVFAGRLMRKAARRMTETAYFVLATARPRGLERFADGFKIAVKVRLMHAQVRRLLVRSERWKWDIWGAPLNQADLAGTNLALSALIVDGLRRLGFRITRPERDGFVQLWKYVGYLLGCDEALLCSTYDEAWSLQQLMDLTQAAPDDDARALVQAHRAAVLPPPLDLIRRAGALHDALCRSLLGEARADALGFPRTHWRAAMPLLRAAFGAADLVRLGVPGSNDALVRACTRMYERAVSAGLEGQRPEYAMPEALRRSVVERRTVVHGRMRALEGT